MKQVVKVLLIEDDEDDALLTKEYLEEIDNYVFAVTWQPDLAQAKNSMLEGDYEIFLVDYRLGGENGLDLIRFIHNKGVLTPAIILTGQGDLEVDIDASRSGAADYLIKSELSASTLERTIRYALSQARTIKELNEKEKKYRLLFERSADPIFLTTEKFEMMDVNNSFLNFFGFHQSEAASIKLTQIFSDPRDYERFKSQLQEKGQVKDFEATLITKSNEPRICHVNCIFIPDQSSEFCCYQGIIHDLTVRKQA
jgi:PAS domain S-box-containing protein